MQNATIEPCAAWENIRADDSTDVVEIVVSSVSRLAGYLLMAVAVLTVVQLIISS